MVRTLGLIAVLGASAGGCLFAPSAPAGGDGGANPDAGTSGITQTAYIKLVNRRTGDQAGHAVALSGDGNTLAVGVPLEDGGGTINEDPVFTLVDAGAVYVFQRTDSGWAQTAYIKPSAPEAGARFGASVALSDDGTTLAVGAPDPTTAGTRAGLAYVFTNGASGWAQQAVLQSDAPDARDEFGASVALSGTGDRLAVGVPGEDSGILGNNQDNALMNAGAVYVFTRSGQTWPVPVYLNAPTRLLDARYGTAVAISSDGTVIAAGAPGDSSAGLDGRGAVYVHLTPSASATTWTTGTVGTVPGLGNTAELGGAVSLSGSGARLVASALGDPTDATGITAVAPSAGGALTRAGAGFLYEGGPATLVPSARVKASNPGVNDLFGTSVALSRDGAALLMGAPRERSAATGIDGNQGDDSADLAGAAYLYTLTDPRRQLAYLKASNTAMGDQFGSAVALSRDGTTLAVGAPTEDGAGRGIDAPEPASTATANSGAVYVFSR